VAVRDDYRWLEDATASEVKAWSDGQNAWARSVLDRLPSVPALRTRLREIASAPSPSWSALARRGDALFALKSDPPKQQPFLVRMATSADPATERVLVDPNALDASGGTAIDWYVPSVDGKIVAVSLSKGGSEAGDVHVFDGETGKPFADVIRASTAARRAAGSRGTRTAAASSTRAIPAARNAAARTSTSTRRSGATVSARRLTPTPTRSAATFRGSPRRRCTSPTTADGRSRP
jgi:prolyl oligopeptidase PreP (S9A serine peptidase family)